LHVCDVRSHQRFTFGQFIGSAGQFSVEPQSFVHGSPGLGGGWQKSVNDPSVKTLVHCKEGSHWTLPAQDAPAFAYGVQVPGHRPASFSQYSPCTHSADTQGAPASSRGVIVPGQ
jgi:hypothetical protein